MHIIVIGAGVVGISTAYYLVRAGHRVSLIERHPEPAREASFANGGQLSYRYVAPLAAPDVPAKLPGWLLAARRKSGLSAQTTLRPSYATALAGAV